MSYNFFAYISRMRYIGRWSLMRNSLPENIQEHSHMVAVIAHALGIIRRDVFGIDCDPEEYAAAALYHDCPEILTGDLPTPIKYHSAEIMGAYKQVEALACEKLLATLPDIDASSLAGKGPFDLIIANINLGILLRDMGHYTARLKQGGMLYMSGFYTSDVPQLLAEAGRQGLTLADQRETDGWACLKLTKA